MRLREMTLVFLKHDMFSDRHISVMILHSGPRFMEKLAECLFWMLNNDFIKRKRNSVLKRTRNSLERILVLIKSRKFAWWKYLGWARKQDLSEEEICYNWVSFPALWSHCWWLGFHLCGFFFCRSFFTRNFCLAFFSSDYKFSWIAARID